MSTAQVFVIEGRVVGPDGDGVHGLVVDVTDRDLVFYEDLGSTRTRRDGGFRIEYRPDLLSHLFDGRPEVSIVVRDASGASVYRGAEVECAVGQTARFDVVVEGAVLDRHHAYGRTLTPPPGPVLDDATFGVVSAAWDALAQSGRPIRHGAFRRSWTCPLPPMAKIEDLIPTALATIAGDMAAAQRFGERLDQFAAQSAAGADAGPALSDARSWKALESALRVRVGEHVVGESVVTRDAALALFAATLLVGHARDPEFAGGYIGVVADQICPIEQFGGVVRAARRVLRSDVGAAESFERELRGFWGGTPECGPIDGPLPPWPDPDPDPFPPRPSPCPSWPPRPPFTRFPEVVLEKLLCQAEMVNALRRILANRYTITALSPRRGCPGQTLVITGTNFGTAPGVVRFGVVGGESVDVTPSSWSDTRVQVVVPGGAQSGPLSLIIPNETIEVCGRFIDFNRQALGTPPRFEGGTTQVTSVVISGTPTAGCADPRTPLTVHWETSNTDSVTLDISTSDGTVLHSETGYEPGGSYRQTLPHWTTTHTMSIRVTASGPCGTHTATRTVVVQRPYALVIDGVELTQAIQYYHAADHLTDPADRDADNSVRLVAGKGALLRVYLRSGQDADFANGDLPNVTGTVTVERRVSGAWQTVQALTPLNAPFTAVDEYASYDAERGVLGNSLNFPVPAAVMTGRLRFTVEVNSPDACSGGTAEAVLNATVDLQQTLTVRAVAIGYQGNNLATPPAVVTFAAPTLAQITTDLAYTMAAYPVQATPVVGLIATVTATQPLNTPPAAAGGCDPNWGPILNQVQTARINDGNLPNAVYYGWVTANIPSNSGNPGCSNSSAAGLVGNGTTVAHELGHQFGLDHAPCNAVGTPNAAYPNYDPYDPGTTTVNAAGDTVWASASIGEYGVDLTTLTLFNPRTANDFMSYCGPQWISLFTHDFLINQARLTPTAVALGASSSGRVGIGIMPTDDTPRSLITMLGTVNADGTVQIQSVSRVVALPPPADGPRTDITAELLGDDASILASAPVFVQLLHGAGCGCACNGEEPPRPPYRFRAVLPDRGRGTGLRLRTAEGEVWHRDAPPTPPQVDNVQAQVGKDGQIHLTWTVTTASTVAPEAWLRWSDDGEHWQGLAVGITTSHHDLDASAIPADRVQLEVVVHDGYETASARSGPIDLPPRPPTAAILHPSENAEPPAGKLHLLGCIIDPGTAPLPDPLASWYLDGKLAAEGLDTWVDSTIGTHELQLRLPGAAPVSVHFRVRPD
ncbi:IPT/TIG domain-containing protein [Nocardia canadensis]|uniref:IPT/TIG domain-containing protein n=1 Tax=Nocardia canadensis TaxID=3065238 RepID=UPI00292FA229|nr:IPT/TIG domain-containing protein [Nocardia canadensis]